MPSLTTPPTGPTYWRSLDELADTPEFRRFVDSEFPTLAQALNQPRTRRSFLKIMGASLGLAGLTACRWPREQIVPATKQPVNRVPGIPVEYATAIELGGVATGLLVTSYDGRPIKIEGNEQHPFSAGKSSTWMQASLLDLYDPDRTVLPVRRADGAAANVPWDEWTAFAREHFAALREQKGAGLAVLAEPSSSPTLSALRADFKRVLPQALWCEYDPLSRDNEREGARQAFGKPLRMHIDFAKADVVVSLDSDFLMTHPAALKYAREYAKRRRATDGQMNRLYVFESAYSVTGSNADHRVACRSGDIAMTTFLLHSLVAGETEEVKESAVPPAVLNALAADLKKHLGRAVVIAGPQQPAAVHALVHAINHKLGAFGKTVTFTSEPDADRARHTTQIAELAGKMAAGDVKTLVILGGNPAYTAPAELDFGAGLKKVGVSIHLGLYDDETSSLCKWHVTQAHYLESWGDARAWDGTVSIVQPLIAPLYDGRSAIELVALMTGDKLASGYELTRRTFGIPGALGGDALWNTALHDGVVKDSVDKPVDPGAPKLPADTATAAEAGRPHDDLPLALLAGLKRGAFELNFRPDYKLLDGRFANNGWLQELPDPITKVTWDNAALISPTDAKSLGIDKNGQVLQLSVKNATLHAPAFILPGHAKGAITLTLGYGRGDACGRVGMNVGANAYALRRTENWWTIVDASASKTGAEHKLVSTQEHQAMKSKVGDDETQRRIPILIREATLEHYKEHPDFVKHPPGVHLPIAATLWQAKEYKDHKWGMAIDLSACIGCGACMTACQSENNIPVVGKDEVALGREMHWIRVDRYFKGEPEADTVEVVHQPVTCVHCENAPCEQVCPVGATMHDEEGLNAMVYNRCIGTRYCNNNCPYKVRRFNWYYNHHGPAHPRSTNADAGGAKVGLLGPTKPGEPMLVPLKKDQTPLQDVEKLANNPRVTVRSRGVMEKCTYCTHRINEVKIQARNERWPSIPDGAITTACAQACPTDAIVFGDLNDKDSRVAKLHKESRAYETLEELYLRARTLYLAKIKNPAGGGESHGGEHGHG